MAINKYNIKKWTKMLLGKSISHVNQGVGTCYSKTEIKGYYNDLTEKVTKDDPNILVPKYKLDGGKEIYFSIGVFQYGLAAYDLYLREKDEKYLKKFDACVNWAMENQQDDGSWNTFSFKYPQSPYSAMAQGEAVSLLIRAYKENGDKKYLDSSKKALEFMLKPLDEGGTTKYDGDDVYLLECTHMPVILNGWIFALFGLMDYLKVDNDNKEISDIYSKTLNSLKNSLADFDTGYWSMYSLGELICSPFYHNLHVALLDVLYDILEIEEFKIYSDKWNGYTKNKFYKAKAFVKKSMQKIFE